MAVDVLFKPFPDTDSGAQNPRTGHNSARLGNAWSNTQRVTASDDFKTSITLTSGVVSDWLMAQDFALATIPDNATIQGIEFVVEKSSPSGETVIDSGVRVIKNGVIGGTDRTASGDWSLADANTTYGGSVDKWGETWTPDDVNAKNFGMALSAVGMASGDANVVVDHITARVYYGFDVRQADIVVNTQGNRIQQLTDSANPLATIDAHASGLRARYKNYRYYSGDSST